MALSSTSRTILSVAEMRVQIDAVESSINRVLGNLADAQGGYPTSTPGAPPTSGNGASEPSTSTERAALSPDAARAALDRVNRLVRDLAPDIADLYYLTQRWAYETHTPALDLDANVEWCDSCLRGQWCEPRYKSRWCWFCSDYRQRFGRLPSLALLERHHRGERITEQMRTDDRPGKRIAAAHGTRPHAGRDGRVR